LSFLCCVVCLFLSSSLSCVLNDVSFSRFPILDCPFGFL
jgi:hypothetical protein